MVKLFDIVPRDNDDNCRVAVGADEATTCELQVDSMCQQIAPDVGHTTMTRALGARLDKRFPEAAARGGSGT